VITSLLSTIDWYLYPKTMRAEHLSDLYGYTLLTVRKMAQKGSSKIPTPAAKRPFGWNRDEVRRHYERRVA
jgi:hypothetical protein